MPSQLIVPPRADLAPWIRSVLVIGFQEASISYLPAVLDPSLVVFARGGSWTLGEGGHPMCRSPRALLAGPRLSPASTYTEAGTICVSIQFRPGVMVEALGPGVNELRDQAYSLDSVFPPAKVRSMLERIDEEQNPLRWVAYIQQVLWESFQGRIDAWNVRLERGALEHLFEPAERLAARLGVGVRQLQRRIDRAYGASLRDLRRMARFGFSLNSLLGNPVRRGHLAGVAHDFGYSDQSHMVHDYVSLCGFSPTELLQSASGGAPGFWIYRLAKRDFETLFLSEDVTSIQETIFASR